MSNTEQPVSLRKDEILSAQEGTHLRIRFTKVDQVAPNRYEVGCQGFSVADALAAGGEMQISPTGIALTVPGVVIYPGVRIGDRTVSRTDVAQWANAVWRVTPEVDEGYIMARAGVFTCTTPGHDHHFILVKGRDGDPAVTRITNDWRRFTRADDFTGFPDCYPRHDTHRVGFEAYLGTSDGVRVKCLSTQFTDATRVQ